MNTDDKDKLKSLFQTIELDSPSSDFENRLMQQIHLKATQKSRKRNFKMILSLTGGILGIFVIPGSIFWLMGLSVDLNFDSPKIAMPHISFDPFIVSIACVALLLLVSDTLIRRRIWEKKHKD